MAGRLLILGCLALVLSGCVSNGYGRPYSSNYSYQSYDHSNGYSYRQPRYRYDYDHDDDRRSRRDEKCGCRLKPFKALKRAFGL